VENGCPEIRDCNCLRREEISQRFGNGTGQEPSALVWHIKEVFFIIVENMFFVIVEK
jgi:hypothetical protein